MDYARAELLFKHPAVRFLRAEQGAFATAFLRTAFRDDGQASLPAELLRTRLEHWLEERRSVETNFAWERSAQEYLDDWSAEDRAWLRKAHAGDLEPTYELTPASEKAISWLDSLTDAAFVGTESRLENIFRELDELLRQASGDAQARLDHLHGERERINTEFTQILTTGKVTTTFEPWQINERYATSRCEVTHLISREMQEGSSSRSRHGLPERRSSCWVAGRCGNGSGMSIRHSVSRERALRPCRGRFLRDVARASGGSRR